MSDGESQFVDISQRDLNLVRTTPGVKAYSTSKNIDIKVVKDNVFIQYMEGMPPSPQEVYFVTEYGTFSLILVPKGIPGETIIIRTPEDKTEQAVQWESNHDHITGLKELIKAMYIEVPPLGFSLSTSLREISNPLEGTWEGISQIYQGATLIGEVHTVMNMADEPLRLTERQFYTKDILAVSIDQHDVRPLGETKVYIVRKSTSQKNLEQKLSSINPMEILKKRRSGPLLQQPKDETKESGTNK
jgi:hypothetical protein